MEERWWVSSDSSGLTTIMILGYVCYHFLPLFIAIFIIATKALSRAHNLLKGWQPLQRAVPRQRRGKL